MVKMTRIGLRCVDRIITDLAVLDVTPDAFILRELAPGVTVDQVRDATEPSFEVDPALKEIAL